MARQARKVFRSVEEIETNLFPKAHRAMHQRGVKRQTPEEIGAGLADRMLRDARKLLRQSA